MKLLKNTKHGTINRAARLTFRLNEKIGKKSISFVPLPVRPRLQSTTSGHVSILVSSPMKGNHACRKSVVKRCEENHDCQREFGSWKVQHYHVSIRDRQKEITSVLLWNIYIVLLLRSHTRKNVSIDEKYKVNIRSSFTSL